MTTHSDNKIQAQVKLPYSVALEVVLQGIRIRMGRSIVTMMGVVLGVAFLMSVFCSNVIRNGIAEESSLRSELSRMLSFLEAEVGSVTDQTFGIVVSGTLSEMEQRFLQRLDRQGVGSLRLYPHAFSGPLPRLGSLQSLERLEEIRSGAAALLVMGGAPLKDLDLHPALPGVPQPVVAATRTLHLGSLPEGIIAVALERELQPEELARAEERALQAKVRNIWIVTIALLVTVIGITNSLLMSVTERFKEIGTMKCLGALSSFIRRIFFIESALTGLVGSLMGGVVGFLVASIIYALTFGFGLVFVSINYGAILVYYLISVLCGISMSILAAIYPASFASRMVPATALRTNI
jgi:hypothetical protein